MAFRDILTHIHFLYNGDHYAPIEMSSKDVQPASYDVCFYHLILLWILSVYFTLLHLKSNLAAGFAKDGQRKKTDLSYTQQESPAHAASAFFNAFLSAFFIYSYAMTFIFSIWPLLNAFLLFERHY